jgi:hypothetical protein
VHKLTFLSGSRDSVADVLRAVTLCRVNAGIFNIQGKEHGETSYRRTHTIMLAIRISVEFSLSALLGIAKVHASLSKTLNRVNNREGFVHSCEKTHT